MTKPKSDYTIEELTSKIETTKAELKEMKDLLTWYEEEPEKRKQEVPLGVPLENLMYGKIWGKYSFCFASDKSKRVFEERFNEYIKALLKLAKGEQIDITVLLPLLPKGWVAMDAFGIWRWYQEKPDLGLCEWKNYSVIPSERLSAFNLKRVEDWRKSLMECGL